MNKIWCWDLEKKFPKYADFKIAENILHLVHNQGLVWMGMFFSPGLPLLNVVKLMLMMYLRSWAVLTCNVPHEVVFRASRSNNFYLALLLTMLFLCVLPVCYAIVRLQPSWHCGPFSSYRRIYLIFSKTLKDTIPSHFHFIMDYMATPGAIIPLIIVLLLVIYYLASLTSALREANIDLKVNTRRFSSHYDVIESTQCYCTFIAFLFRFSCEEKGQRNVRKCFKWLANVDEAVAKWIRPLPSGRKFCKRYPATN